MPISSEKAQTNMQICRWALVWAFHIVCWAESTEVRILLTHWGLFRTDVKLQWNGEIKRIIVTKI